MRYFPVNLDIRDKRAVIVGGGEVALRKCLRLLEAGGRVTVIAPQIDPELEKLRDGGQISHLAREYARGDLEGAFLAFAATDDGTVNRAVAEEAASRGILADITDLPALGNFTSPSVVSRGELLVTVSTGGRSPALSRKIREELEGRFGTEYGETLEILGALREKLLTARGETAYNKRILNDLAGSIPELVGKRDYEEIDRLLTAMAGPGFTLDRLGMGKKDPA